MKITIDMSPEIQKAIEVFHSHLDACSQCAQNPLALCLDGAKLLHAVSDANPCLPPLPTRKK
jgi:hypothetical protein